MGFIGNLSHAEVRQPAKKSLAFAFATVATFGAAIAVDTEAASYIGFAAGLLLFAAVNYGIDAQIASNDLNRLNLG